MKKIEQSSDSVFYMMDDVYNEMPFIDRNRQECFENAARAACSFGFQLCRIEMIGGDKISGKIAAGGNRFVYIDTACGIRFEVPYNMIRYVTILPHADYSRMIERVFDSMKNGLNSVSGLHDVKIVTSSSSIDDCVEKSVKIILKTSDSLNGIAKAFDAHCMLLLSPLFGHVLIPRYTIDSVYVSDSYKCHMIATTSSISDILDVVDLVHDSSYCGFDKIADGEFIVSAYLHNSGVMIGRQKSGDKYVVVHKNYDDLSDKGLVLHTFESCLGRHCTDESGLAARMCRFINETVLNFTNGCFASIHNANYVAFD